MQKKADYPASRVGGLIRKQREAMRMTVAQLADRVGVSRNTITNYEAEKTDPSSSDLMRLATALGCRIHDLLVEGCDSLPPRFAFRAHAPLRRDPNIIAAARRYLRLYDEIEEITSSRLQSKLWKMDRLSEGPIKDRDIEDTADGLRQASGLHDTGPENITSVLEGLGVRTVFFGYEGKGLEGLSTIQDEMPFVMLRDRKRVVERTIFSAAHELGHLVLHPNLFTSNGNEKEVDAKRYEDEADKFAGIFLVPRNELVRIWREEQLGRLSLFNALIILKRVFHVSFHCLHHRVAELKLHPKIAPANFINQIKQQLGIKGPARMEDLEPDPLSPEVLYRTNRFSRLVRSAFLQDLIGIAKVAEMFQVQVDMAKVITTDWLRPKYALVEDGDL